MSKPISGIISSTEYRARVCISAILLLIITYKVYQKAYDKDAEGLQIQKRQQQQPKKIFDELSTVFAGIYKEASEYVLSKSIDFKAAYEFEGQKNFRLLNEYKKAVDESNIVSKTNPKGIITYVNKQFCMISGYREDELIGKSHNIVRHPDMPRSAFKEMWETIKEKRTWKGVVKNLKKTVEPISSIRL